MQRFFIHLFDWNREESLSELIFFRIYEFFVCLFSLQYIWSWSTYIPKLQGVVLPLGLAQYFDVSTLFNDVTPVLIAVGATVFIALSFFRRFSWGYLIALILFHFQYIARFSQGEISHGSNIVAMTLLGLALAFIFFKQEKEARRFAMGLAIFYIGLGYTSAAICKLIATGPAWVSGEHLWLWLGERSVDVLSQTGAFEPNSLQKLIFDSKLAATLILVFGLLAELFGFLFWFKKTRPFIGLTLIGMHFGILMSMNINFDKYIYILFILSFPWERLIEFFIRRFKANSRDGFLSNKILIPR